MVLRPRYIPRNLPKITTTISGLVKSTKSENPATIPCQIYINEHRSRPLDIEFPGGIFVSYQTIQPEQHLALSDSYHGK